LAFALLAAGMGGCSSSPDTNHDALVGPDHETVDRTPPVDHVDVAPAPDRHDAGAPDLMDAGPDATDGPAHDYPPGPPPPGILGPFPLQSCDRISYSVTAQIGGQNLQLTIDTGSGTLAVASSLCDRTCQGIYQYTPGPTATDLMRTTSLSYADMSGWTGEIFEDQVTLQGMNLPVTFDFAAITKNNAFLHAGETCSAGPGFVDDGILGLGPIGSGSPGTDDFISRLNDTYPGMAAAFSFQLCQYGGNLWFGGYDPQFTAGDMKYTPLLPIDPTYPTIAIEIADMGFDGTSLGFTPQQIGGALVDSGTSLMVLPTNIYNALITKVTANANFQQMIGDATFFSSSNCITPTVSPDVLDAMLPPFNLTLPAPDGTTFTINLPPFNSYLRWLSNGANIVVCPGVDSGGSILGDVMLSSQITLIDREARLVGFAPQKGCP
jgi:hypothetical protein